MHATVTMPTAAPWPRSARRRLRHALIHRMGGGGPRGRGRGRSFQPPGYGGFGPPFGRGGPWGHRGFGRGPKARRGDVRLAALLLLAEEPRNGYGIMQEIEQRSEGAWRPSPGSVYPALSQLEDEGLVRSEESPSGTGRQFALSDAGRAHVESLPPDQPAPWTIAADGVTDSTHALMGQLKQMAIAIAQVEQAGTPEQKDRARDLLTETRSRLYGILAEPGDDG